MHRRHEYAVGAILNEFIFDIRGLALEQDTVAYAIRAMHYRE